MDTNGLPPTAPTAPASRQAPTANRYTRQQVADVLGLSVDALRRLQRRSKVPGQVIPAAAGGSLCVLSDGDLQALRLACDNRRQPAPPGGSPGPPPTATQHPAIDHADGWREAVNAERGRTAAAVGESDHLRAELACVRQQLESERRAREEADRGRAVAEQRTADLRAAWWQWYAVLTRRPLWRLRRLPSVPPDLGTGLALPAPKG